MSPDITPSAQTSVTTARRRLPREIIRLFEPSIPEIGKVALGVKTEKACKDVPHFVFPPETLAKFPSLTGTYGKDPKEINILLPSDDPTDFFDAAWREWKGNNKLRCHSYNGVNALLVNQNGVSEDVACPQLAITRREESGVKCPRVAACAHQLRLTFFLYITPEEPALSGVFRLYTKSKTGIEDLLNCLHWIKTMTGGQLANIPLVLYREHKKIAKPGTDTMIDHWPLKLRLHDEAQRAFSVSPVLPVYRLGRRVDAPAPAVEIAPAEAPKAITGPAHKPPFGDFAAQPEALPSTIEDEAPENQPVFNMPAAASTSDADFIKSAMRDHAADLVKKGVEPAIAAANVAACFAKWVEDRFDVQQPMIGPNMIDAMPADLRMFVADAIDEAKDDCLPPWAYLMD